MDHYLDLILLPDPEFAPTHLMNALAAKLHRALAHREKGDIGMSFPRVQGLKLGNHLRLHGTSTALSELMAQSWLTGMRDHLKLGEVTPIPADVKHCVVRRVQVKSNPERIRRRQMKRHGYTAEEARERIPDSAAKTVKLPYIQLRSNSSGHLFPLYIQHGPPQASGQPGTFSAYGLSDTATIPWF